MTSVESSLARVSQNCNPRGLERITKNAAKMDAHTRSRGQSLSLH
jgi:hypothetical protein